MYRNEDTNWIDRWEKLTGNRPDDSLRRPKAINNQGLGKPVATDALKLTSQQFKRRKP